MKLKLLHVSVVALGLFFSKAAQSQDAAPSHVHLKPIESLVGVWKTRFDPPGNVPEGDLEIHIQWIGNKSYLQSSVYFHPDGTPPEVQLNPEFIIVGVDLAATTIKVWQFEYQNQKQMDAKIESNRLVIYQREASTTDANQRRPSKIYELESPETLIIKEVNKSADSPANDPPPLRLKKSMEK